MFILIDMCILYFMCNEKIKIFYIQFSFTDRRPDIRFHIIPVSSHKSFIAAK